MCEVSFSPTQRQALVMAVLQLLCLCVCVGGSCESCRGLPAAAQHEVSYPVIISKGSATAQHHSGIPAPTDRPKGKFSNHCLCMCLNICHHQETTGNFLTAPFVGNN